jgi:polar amino acid transport system substrate-binding protein
VFAPRRVLVSFTALTAGAVMLAGCASSGSKSSSTSAPATGVAAGGATSAAAPATSSPAASSPAAGGAAAALVPSAIKSKGTIVVAMDATYPPDESVAKDGHTIVGFDADLGKALAQELGLKADLKNVKFDNIIPGLQDGKYDMGLSSFTDTKEREKVVDFVTYFKAGEAFYVKAGSGKKFDGLASLCNATVAVESGTTEESDAQSQGKKCKVTVQSFADQNQANLAVASGRADVGFADSQVVGYIVKQSNGQFEQTGTAFEVAPYGIALPKGNGMAKAVQAGLKDLISNGTYNQLAAKWGVRNGAIRTPVINGAIS